MRRVFVLSAIVAVLAVPGPAQAPVVHRVVVSGTIENGLAPYVARALREAEAAGAAAAYLDIDTPGGRVDAAERIADAVRDATIPVYAFVNPRAYSAGALIALASDGIYMRPGAVIGAATPVDGQGTKAPEKYVSAMRAEFRAIAEERGLDPKIAEAMVDESIAIPGVVDSGKLLTLSTREALQVRFARAEVPDEPALLAAVGLPGATVVTIEANWAELAVRFLTHPLVQPLLLSLGMLGLVFEIKSGGFGLGGALSVGSIGLFFGSSLLLGLAGWEEVLLLLGGLIAIGVEIFLLPGFGVAGILGALLTGAAVVLAMLGNIPTVADVSQALIILAASVVITGAVAYAWLRHLPSSGRLRGLLLHDAVDKAGGFLSAPERLDLVGREATAVTDLRPAGTVKLDEELIDVVTEGGYVASGSRVKFLRAEGYRQVVRRID